MTIKTVVTGKNQVTIPAALARELNIEVGTQLEWEIRDDSYFVVRPVLSKAEIVRQLEERFKDVFPPGSDPIGDLIRERVEDDIEEGLDTPDSEPW